MINEKKLYSNKNIKDPWGQLRSLQKLRRENYVKNLKIVFPHEKFENALDLACGAGYLSQELSIFCSNLTLSDFYQEVLEICKINTKNRFEYKKNKLPEINFNKKFDIIFAIEVLYYLDEDEQRIFFCNVTSIMHRNSYLVITINEEHFLKINKMFQIVSSFVRYVPILDLPDLFYQIEKYYELSVDIIFRRKDINVSKLHEVNENLKIIRKYRYLLLPTLFFLPFKFICPFLYKSDFLAHFFYNIGYTLKLKHDRKLMILKLKN